MGEGPIDIVRAPRRFSHVERYHDFPEYQDFFRRLAALVMWQRATLVGAWFELF